MSSTVVFVAALHPGQAAIYNSPARFKVVAAGRRFGKSEFAAYMLRQEVMRTTNDRGYELTAEHGVYYVAPTADQAKRVMWPKLRKILGYERNGGLIRNENVNDGWIEVVNGRRIYLKGAEEPDRLRGIALSYVVLDEYADMKAMVWEDIIEQALIDVEGSALFIGTPKGKNHFYRLFMGALEKPATKDEHGKWVDYWEDWEAFHFKSTDNPFLSARELKRQMNDPRKSRDTVRQELEASFVSGGSKVLKPENFPIIARPPPNAVEDGSVVITVDLAGFKKQEGNKVLRTDETVICETLVHRDEWFVLRMQHGHWDVRETALRIIRTASKHYSARLGIEQGALKEAVGWHLDQYMREFNRYITPEPLRHNNQRKTDRIVWALQGRSERGKIQLVADDALDHKERWNTWFLDQLADFPDPLAHDDGPDVLAYADQLAVANYADADEIDEWEPEDITSGY